MKDTSIYEKCPVYRSDRFLLRLVDMEDSEDLLKCYSDLSAVRLMNSDNCTCGFHFRTQDEMDGCIRDWLEAYERGHFIRFSIVDTRDNKAVGTIEMFDYTKTLGIFRLDLCSDYEKQDYLAELIGLSVEKLYEAYGVKRIMVKAIPSAKERISALSAYCFVPAEKNTTAPRVCWTWVDGEKQPFQDDGKIPYADYYIHEKMS